MTNSDAFQLDLFGGENLPPNHIAPAQPISPDSSIPEVLPAYSEYLTGKGSAQHTIYNFTSDVQQLGRFYPHKPSSQINSSDLQRFLGFLQNRHRISRRSAQRKLVSFRNFFGFLHSQKTVRYNPARSIFLSPQQPSLPHVLSEEEVERFIEAASENVLYHTLFSLFRYTGAKREVAFSLGSQDLFLERNPPAIFLHKLRYSRYGRDRTVPIHEPLVQILQRYLPTMEGPLLFPIHTRTLASATERYSQRARLNRIVTPELLRDTFAVNWLKEKVPSEQELIRLGMEGAAEALKRRHDLALQHLLGLSDRAAESAIPGYRMLAESAAGILPTAQPAQLSA